ncbi:melanopsin-B [Hydra vulgaris]|uniref:Opsin n=1 Tax=Hydra vulgaris TaxID=6087 RepID=A0A857GWU9_HYDVU|nr:melanopsin-B-like [Hydra vulgaris]QHF16595.1 opsin [Hydra vulgaris]
MDAVKITLLTITSLAIITNVISIYILYKKRAKNNYVILCINLSLSDLLQSVAGYIPSFILKSNLKTATVLCKSSAFFIAFPSYTTIATLTAIAFSRFLLLSTHCNTNQVDYKKLFVKIATFSWIYGFTWAVLPFLGFSSYTLEDTHTRCAINFSPKTKVDKAYLILLMAFGFFIPVIIILTSCLFTADLISTKYEYFFVTYGKENVETKRYKEKEKKAFSSFLLMVLSFIICWTPYATIGCLSAFTSTEIPKMLIELAALFAKLAALVNPFIYFWKDSLLKKVFKNKMSQVKGLPKMISKETK